MTTIELVPVRAILIKAFNYLAEKAQLVDSITVLTSFPPAFTLQEKTNVKRQVLEDYVRDEYRVPQDRMENALRDLQDKGIIDILPFELNDERASYVNLTQKALNPTRKDLDNLFSKHLAT